MDDLSNLEEVYIDKPSLDVVDLTESNSEPQTENIKMEINSSNTGSDIDQETQVEKVKTIFIDTNKESNPY